ncbi:lysozyme inhibitor LprI family protein [Oceaniglobus roseus]|uniref:lysozyme inhibitor LprI family protein n=1 Tax=Oceaniglobus roseus TaxID=1737570 RepID=UPI000C7F2BEC|nr:lysozyme inhibitor LprI family protein [Kandeliimicrobium roseum]
MPSWPSLCLAILLPLAATAQISTPEPPPAPLQPLAPPSALFPPGPPPDGQPPAINRCGALPTQMEATACADRAYRDADAALNAAYRAAMATAERLGTTNGVAATTMLRDAQRAWIPFRDAACAAEAQLGAGGTIMGQLTLECLARLTLARTDDLRLFAAGL